MLLFARALCLGAIVASLAAAALAAYSDGTKDMGIGIDSAPTSM